MDAWLADAVPGLPPESLQQGVSDMALTVRLAQESAGLRHLGAWTAEHVAAVIATADTVEQGLEDGAGPDGVDPLVADLTQRVIRSLSPLMAFLVDTGRWTGTRDDLAGVRATLDQVSPAALQAQALAEVLDRPEDPAAEAAALADLPLARHLVALLRWTAPHRDVTETGEPLPADLPGAAAAVGVDVDPGAPPTTLRDIPRLLNLWLALDDTELLDSSATGIFPAVAPDVLASDAPLTQEQLRDAVELAVQTILEEASDPGEEPDDRGELPVSTVAVGVLPLLGMAATGVEVSAEVLAGADELAGTGVIVEELRDLGVLREGTEPGSVVVTPGLEKLLASCALELLEEVTSGEDWDDEWDDDAD